MTEEEILQWQCDMHIMSCSLYSKNEKTALDDAGYDSLCQTLLHLYDRLPDSFTERVGRDHLKTGTTMGLTFTEEEYQRAVEWRDSK